MSDRDELEEMLTIEFGFKKDDLVFHKLVRMLNRYIDQVSTRRAAEARQQLALTFIEKLDEANVPQEVVVPELVGDDLTTVSVPVVSGEYWQNVHKALKYMREATTAELQASLQPTKGSENE